MKQKIPTSLDLFLTVFSALLASLFFWGLLFTGIGSVMK